MDTRLGCLQAELPSDSDQLALINAVSDIFITNGKLDDGIPFWKLLPNASPNFRKFSNAYDVYTKTAAKYIHKSMERISHLKVTPLRITNYIYKYLMHHTFYIIVNAF